MNDDSILINFNFLDRYLKSSDSMFELSTVNDFLNTLHVLGFSRSGFQEKNQTFLSYRYYNSRFKPNEPIPDELYKTRPEVNQKPKRAAQTQITQFFKRILKLNSRHVMTKLQFEQLKMNFALDNKLNEQRQEKHFVEFTSEEPEYTKKDEVAGYYGHNVSIEELKEAFLEYLPIFSNDPVPGEAGEDHTDLNISGVEKMDFEVESDLVPIKSPKRKKPKGNKHSAQVKLETEQALMYLHQSNFSAF